MKFILDRREKKRDSLERDLDRWIARREGVEMFLCIAVFEKRHGALEKGTEGIQVFVLPKRISSFPSCF